MQLDETIPYAFPLRIWLNARQRVVNSQYR
jgi:hypothetical protein